MFEEFKNSENYKNYVNALMISISGLSREQQMENIIERYNNCCQTENWIYALVFCDLLIEKYQHFGMKETKAKLLYESEFYIDEINYTSQLLNEWKSNSEIGMFIKSPLYFCALSYCELEQYEDALRTIDLLIDIIKGFIQKNVSSNNESNLASAYSLREGILSAMNEN